MKKFAALLLTIVFSAGCFSSSFAKDIDDIDVSLENARKELEDSADINLNAENKIVAFPGAEGAGKYATGGRGGKIYHVTTLDDWNPNDKNAKPIPGSFRDAVSGSNRIVVFDVGGTIELKSDVVVKGNITIAGQTAPGGGGITLKNYKLGMGGNNIIMRFVSSRPGPGGKSNDYDGWGGSDGSLSMIDHCATGWATDEQFALYSNNMYQTVQWSVIGPSNSWGGHPKGAHGFGIMFGKGQNSWHHNMIAHNISRNYRGKVVGTYVMDYVNNVVYDWGYQTAYGTHGHINYVGNYFKAGNSTTDGYEYFKIDGSERQKYRFYLTGNKILNKDGSIYNDADNNWDDKVINYATTLNNKDILDSNGKMLTKGYCKVDERMPLYNYGSITKDSRGNNVYNPDSKGEDLSVLADGNVDTADEAFEKVLAYAGAGINAGSRPPIDKEVMNDAKNGTGTLTGSSSYASASESVKATITKNKIQCDTVFEYPKKITTTTVVDSDGDGMPDWWEKERGLNPESASDMNGDYCGLGYTNIEYYLNDLTVDAFPEGVVTISPTNKNSVVVDPLAPEVEGESYKTFAMALDYMKMNSSSMAKGRKTIYVSSGIYDEEVDVDQKDLNIIPKDGDTGEIKVARITVWQVAQDVIIRGISMENCTVLADRAVLENCKFLNTELAVLINAKVRAYFKDCVMNGPVSADSRAVFNKCTISANDFIAKSTRETDDKYGILIMNSKVNGTGNTLLADKTGTNGQVVYYKCEISNVAGRSSVSDKSETRIRIASCETGGVTPAYSESLSEYDYNERFTPFIHLKERYGSKADNWNPDSFNEVSPQTKLKELADSISVKDTIILKNTELVSSFDTDLALNVKWESTDSSILNGNTIVVGEYGGGVKYAKLKVTLSVDGYKDEVREFDVIVGSSTEGSDSFVSFNDEAVGGDSKNIKTPDKNVVGSNISWGVTNNISENEYPERGNFYEVKQSATTGDTTCNFSYNFGGDNSGIIEAGFDIYVGDIDTDSKFEVYLRGGSTIGEMRFTIDSVEVKTDNSNRTKIANVADEWLKFKMVSDTRGVFSGTEPKIDYYLCDDEGNVISKVENAKPSSEYSVSNASRFVPNRIEFRPDRSKNVCEFYIDNLYCKDLTAIAKEDAEALSSLSYNMNVGDRLPGYGNQLSNVVWRTVEGQNDVINSDGTIDYSKCGVTMIKVKADVEYGENIKGVAESEDIVAVVNGTGQNSEVVSDKFFDDGEDFGKWYKEKFAVDKDGNTVDHKIDIANKDTIQGNNTVKIKLPDKAVFKKFNTPVSSGKATFAVDFLKDAEAERTFRIFLENAETADDGNGFGKDYFVGTNVFYHLTDIGGVTKVITSDNSDAKTGNYTSEDIGKLDANKWYRIKVDLDLDAKTAKTGIYLHGTDGLYNTENISAVPIKEITTDLISKTPLRLKQIRLVKTAPGSNIYFDNVSVSGERNVTGVTISEKEVNIEANNTYQLYAIVSPFEALNKNITWSSSNPNVAAVDENGLVTAVGKGEAVIKVTTEDGGFEAECKVNVAGTATSDSLGNLDDDDVVTVDDAALALKYVLTKDTTGIADGKFKNINVTGGTEPTAKDVAAILRKALEQDEFSFITETD